MKRFGLLHALAALAVATIVGCGATGGGESEGEEGDAVGEVEQDIGGGNQCCSVGYYRCPNTGEVYDYAVPGCDSPNRNGARAMCNFNCSVTCTDSGWHNGC